VLPASFQLNKEIKSQEKRQDQESEKSKNQESEKSRVIDAVIHFVITCFKGNF